MTGDDHQRQADRHDAEHARRFDDVGKDADLEEVRDHRRKYGKHEDKHEPDEIIENVFEGFACTRRHQANPNWRGGVRGTVTPDGKSDYFTDSIVPAGGLRLPQNAGLSTLALVIAEPGTLMFGPHGSIVTSLFRPSTS